MKNLFLLGVLLGGLVTAGCDYCSLVCKKDKSSDSCVDNGSCCKADHSTGESVNRDESQVATEEDNHDSNGVVES